MLLFLALFILVPLVELWVLIAVGDEIGALNTVVLVVFTAMLGVAIIRRQGLSTLMRVNQRLAQGEVPAEEMLEGMCLAAAGIMLLVPGFISDGLGFLLLLPPLRSGLSRWLVRTGRVRGAGNVHMQGFSYEVHTRRQTHHRGANVFEGEYDREEPPTRRLPGEDDEPGAGGGRG